MKLSKREKVAIFAVAAVAAAFVVMQFVVPPFLEKRERLARALTVKSKMLAELIDLSAQYESIKAAAARSRAQLAKREKNFTLFSFLDRLSGKAGVKANVVYMKPTTSIDKQGKFKLSQVELRLRNVSLNQITAFLHMVETSQNFIYIRRLSMNRSGKKGGLIDATLLAETFET